MIRSKIEKTKEETDLVIYRLDLTAETHSEVEALEDLENEPLRITDQMIESIVEQNVRKLLESYDPEWEYDWEKVHGKPAFYIRLKAPKDTGSGFH